MVAEGDSAPEFTAPLAAGDVEPFTLDEHLDDGPLVLAFFPAAFTGTCTSEMRAFEQRLDDFEAGGAEVYGISTDLPFALNEFRDQESLSFGLISDTERALVDAYDVRMDFADLGVRGVARRAVFVVDAKGDVTYAWESDDPGVEPDYDEVADAVTSAALAAD